jgi:NAD(P)-dependent dehydrogenase (short-subunit alcohol dehydrogenase family)
VRRILVTGANKGIGLAIVRAILEEHDDTFVYLGSRDPGRGRAAAASLPNTDEWKERIEIVSLDVSADRSVAAAAEHIARSSGGNKLYALVNNAGIGGDAGASLAEVLHVNTLGIHRVCESFLPLMDPMGGRIVNVTSAAGPSFVATCSAEMQRFFVDGRMTAANLRDFVDECIAMGDDKAAFAAKGLGQGSAFGGAYGLSKALANACTLLLAREHPNLRINACTPGFIDTDMTRPYAESKGKSPADLGMKAPAAGTRAPMHLLFGDLEGNGRYYGSDAQRSPLDRYRSPGSAPYTGD